MNQNLNTRPLKNRTGLPKLLRQIAGSEAELQRRIQNLRQAAEPTPNKEGIITPAAKGIKDEGNKWIDTYAVGENKG